MNFIDTNRVNKYSTILSNFVKNIDRVVNGIYKMSTNFYEDMYLLDFMYHGINRKVPIEIPFRNIKNGNEPKL